MFAQRQSKNFAQMAEPYRIWKEKPPGPEQRELERMFDCKEISASATPESIRKKNPMFMQFNSKTFSAHFRKTKAKYGLSALPLDVDEEPLVPNSILELGFERPLTPPPQFSSDEGQITFGGAPFFTWKYTDHDKKCDFVIVAVPIISGSRKVDFALADDGLSVTVVYTWPIALYRSDDLFKGIPRDHPKVHSFISHMLDCGITEKSMPQGTIKINLPCRVKRESDAFKKSAVKVDDTKIVLLEFAAYQKEKIINDADTSINFD